VKRRRKCRAKEKGEKIEGRKLKNGTKRKRNQNQETPGEISKERVGRKP